MPYQQGSYLTGLLWAAAAILIWAGSLVVMRAGVTTSLNIYDVTALRFGVAALVLCPVILRQGFGLDRLGLSGFAMIVVGFGAPYILLLALAMTYVPATAAGALNPGVMAVCSVFIGALLFRERIGLSRIAGLALTMAGIALLAFAQGGLNMGHLILFLTGLMWASYPAVIRKTSLSALHATAVVAVGSAIFYLPIYLIALPKRIMAAPMQDIVVQAGFQGVLVSTLAVYAFSRSAELLGSTTGATLPALIPVVTLGIGALTLGETAGLSEIASCLLIGLGLILILLQSVARPRRWRLA